MLVKSTAVYARIVFALFIFTIMVGCGSDSAPITSESTKYQVDDDSSSSTSDNVSVAERGGVQQTPTEPTPPVRPKPMTSAPDPASPAGESAQPTAEQLLSIIERLRQQQPKQSNNQDEVIADFVNIQGQVIQAAEMVMEMDASDDAIKQAASAKISALSDILRVVDAKGVIDELFKFAKELEQHPSEEISKFGRQQSFVTLLNAFEMDQVTDAQHVIDEFKKLAAEQPKERGLLAFGSDVADRFMSKGFAKESAMVLRHTAGLVQPTEDAQLDEGANSLIERARFAELDLGTKLRAVAMKEEGSVEEFLELLGELTSGDRVGATTLETLRQIGNVLEAEHGEVAARVYDILEASFGKGADAELAEDMKQMIDKYRRRSAIVGNPFSLEGNLVDGTPFDWEKYKGKVVLVDFWATWCRPCLDEMPNIRANYEKYREHGFEVVGVNMDDTLEALENFSTLQPLPWPSVVSAVPTAFGWNHPMATKNGVASIPFLVLVDRTGTAISLNTRGPALGERLAELFPEAAPATDEPETPAKDPATPPAATEDPATEDAATPAKASEPESEE